MKILKVMLISILCALTFFSTFTAVFAVNTNNDNYNFLIENSYDEDFLNNLTDSMINKMAKKIKEVSDPNYLSDYKYLLSVGIPENFLKGLAETSLSIIRDYISDSNVSSIDYITNKAASSDAFIKKLSIQLSDENNASVVGEIVCIYWEHEINKPILRDEDFVEVGWNGDVFCYDADTFYAEDYRRNTTEETWKVSKSYKALATISFDRIGHWTELYTIKKQVGGFMIFKLSPTKPIDCNTDYDTNLIADYSYAAETKDYSTVILCTVFILLILTALTIITRIRKKNRK